MCIVLWRVSKRRNCQFRSPLCSGPQSYIILQLLCVLGTTSFKFNRVFALQGAPVK